MAKSELRLRAIELRRDGKSIRNISRELGVAKSSASLWVRDVVLTFNQLEQLRKNPIIGSEKVRINQALKLKNARLNRIHAEQVQGLQEFNHLTPREQTILGLALYWAEGSKKQRRVMICNSDPFIIKIFIRWIKEIYNIPPTDFSCSVGINEAHRSRDNQVKDFWSQTTGIPLSSFTKTSFKKYPLKKTFENFNEHFGTLAVRVRKPARIYYKILGQIHGLSMAT